MTAADDPLDLARTALEPGERLVWAGRPGPAAQPAWQLDPTSLLLAAVPLCVGLVLLWQAFETYFTLSGDRMVPTPEQENRYVITAALTLACGVGAIVLAAVSRRRGLIITAGIVGCLGLIGRRTGYARRARCRRPRRAPEQQEAHGRGDREPAPSARRARLHATAAGLSSEARPCTRRSR